MNVNPVYERLLMHKSAIKNKYKERVKKIYRNQMVYQSFYKQVY